MHLWTLIWEFLATPNSKIEELFKYLAVISVVIQQYWMQAEWFREGLAESFNEIIAVLLYNAVLIVCIYYLGQTNIT